MTRPYSEKILSENLSIRGFSKSVSQSELVWHRDREDRTIVVAEGYGWHFQRDNELPVKIRPGDRISVRAGEYHRLIKGGTDLVVTVVKEGKKKDQNKDGKNDFDDVKIARMKAQGMSDDEIKKKHPDLYEKYINEKKKAKTDFDKGTGEPGYLKGRSEKDRKANQKLTRQLKGAKTQKAKEKIYDKINKQRAKEKEDMAESKSIRITDPDILREYLEEIVEEQKLYAALEEVYAIEEAEAEEAETLLELAGADETGDLDEKSKRKKKRKKRKKRKSSKSGRTLSKAVKKSLDKKADRRCLTRGSVYAEFRAGLGAFYSSGSRKGMSAHQWAHARVNSANPSKSWARVKKRKKCPKKKRSKK